MMKTLYVSFLLLFALFTLAYAGNKMTPSDVQSLTFDVTEVPFSRYGSYMSLIAQNKENGFQELGLYDLTGNVIWDANKRIMIIQPVHAGDILPVNYTGNPVERKGKTKTEAINIYYETPRVLHICSQGTDMQLTGNIGDHILSVPGYPDSYILYDRGIVLTARAGRINLFPENEIGTIRLEQNAEGNLDIVVEQYYGDWVPKHYTENRDQSIDKLTNEFILWENNLPSVKDKYVSGKRLAAYINWSCIYEPRENITRFGMAMSKGGMSYIWSWDHCFNAMSLSYHQSELSWDQLMIMFDHQNPETGALPDLISSQSINWRAKKPPIHGWTLSELMKEYPLSENQLQEAYSRLTLWTNYWLICRDTNRNGLCEYYNALDSGWDNGTSFEMGVPAESPDLAAYLILQMEVLADLAGKLSYKDEAKEWQMKSQDMLDKMLKTFWNGDKFVTIKADDGSINPASQSLMSYLPIILGKRLPRDIRNKMIRDLKKEGYLLTPYGVASESPQSPYYVEDGYWKGPIWAPTIVILCKGLRSCGEEALAQVIAERFCNNCLNSGFSENYNALTGKPLRDLTYTWTSSAFLVIAHEFLNESK